MKGVIVLLLHCDIQTQFQQSFQNASAIHISVEGSNLFPDMRKTLQNDRNLRRKL